MTKYIKILLIAVWAIAACACSTNRRAYNNDDIYYKQMGASNKGGKAKPNDKNKAKDKGKLPKSSGKECQRLIMDEAYSWLGVPYASGGHSKRGTDCSGFVMEVYKKALGIDLPRNSAAQSEACHRIKKSQLQAGDLVFFHPSKKGRISHVGIYVGDNKMIHASSHGVMVNDLSEVYYERCYSHSGRVPAMEELLSK